MGTVTQEDLKPLVHLSLVCINLPHGPEESDYRFNQLVDFMSDHIAHASPKLSPLFQHMYPELPKELEHEAGSIRGEGERMEMAGWNCLRNRSLYKKKGNRAHTGRYGRVTTEVLEIIKNWNSCLFDSTVLSAEGGLLNQQNNQKGEPQVQWGT